MLTMAATTMTATARPMRMPPATPLTAKPISARMATGTMAASTTIAPIETWPVICSPQRSRKMCAERLRVSIGPVPSSVRTGTARNVTRFHATAIPPSRRSPRGPARSASPRMTMLTLATSAAHPAMAPSRWRATAMPLATVASSPFSTWAAAAARATLKKIPAKVSA